jgi:type I restriction enzyme M protein
MHDENIRAKLRQTWQRRFWAGPREQFEAEGRKAIRVRIDSLFNEVKEQYKNIFRGNEEIALSDRALAFIVFELAKYDFTRTDVDAKGVAYQELVGVNLRGDRGQYFTPRGVVKLVIEMLDPKEGETLLDPACGTGGFLVATLGQMLKKFRHEQNTQAGDENTIEFFNVHERLKEYAGEKVFGADFDPFLNRAAQMNMVQAGDGRVHTYNINSLEFPLGHLADLQTAKKEIPLGSVHIIATNPPFGSGIPITDKHIQE